MVADKNAVSGVPRLQLKTRFPTNNNFAKRKRSVGPLSGDSLLARSDVFRDFSVKTLDFCRTHECESEHTLSHNRSGQQLSSEADTYPIYMMAFLLLSMFYLHLQLSALHSRYITALD